MIVCDGDGGVGADSETPSPVAFYSVVVSGRVNAANFDSIRNVTRLVVVSIQDVVMNDHILTSRKRQAKRVRPWEKCVGIVRVSDFETARIGSSTE